MKILGVVSTVGRGLRGRPLPKETGRDMSKYVARCCRRRRWGDTGFSIGAPFLNLSFPTILPRDQGSQKRRRVIEKARVTRCHPLANPLKLKTLRSAPAPTIAPFCCASAPNRDGRGWR